VAAGSALFATRDERMGMHAGPGEPGDGPGNADRGRAEDDAVAIFLDALAYNGNPFAASRISGLSRRRVGRLREEDAEFAAAYDEALDDAADRLEEEAWRRALEGVPQPVMRGGQVVLDPDTGKAMTVRRYSDALLVMLLRGNKPDKFLRRAALPATVADQDNILREIAADDDPSRSDPAAPQ